LGGESIQWALCYLNPNIIIRIMKPTHVGLHQFYQQNFWKIKSSQSLFYLFNLQFLLPLVDIVIGTGHDVVYLIFCGTEISWASFLLVCLKGTVGGTSFCIVTKLTTSPTLYVLWFAIVICLLCRVISLL